MLKHRAARRAWPNEPICPHQIDSYLPRTALSTAIRNILGRYFFAIETARPAGRR